MTEPVGVDSDDDRFDEIRAAAGAVVASLKWLLEATERIVEDPQAFAQAAASGRSIVDAVIGGFVGHDDATGDDEEQGSSAESQ